MIQDFTLLAIVSNRKQTVLMRIPLHKSLENHVKESWNSNFDLFVHDLEKIEFKPGFKPKRNQCFRFLGFDLPTWMSGLNNKTAMNIDEITRNQDIYNSLQGTVVFTRSTDDEEVALFQDFSRSNVIYPGRFLRFDDNTFMITEQPGFLLERELSAVYFIDERKLLFRNFRAVNSFLPVFEFYKTVSEQEIHTLLNHRILDTQDPESWAKGANQWFRTRFSLLSNSGILDRYTAEEIKERSIGYDVPIQIVNGKIVFPSDNGSAKELLKFLNEEIYSGAITDTIYETNSKKVRS